MKPVLIVTHLDDRKTGLVGEAFAGCPVVGWHSGDNAPLPALDGLSGIVSLGGTDSATDVYSNPFLAAEVELMRAALAQPVPILGMCLGAQLLAVAAGGRVRPMGRMYAGWPELSLLAPSHQDPLFGALDSGLPVLKWHEDMIEVPDGATVLGESASTRGTALFRIGPAAWGSQPHLEADPAMLLDGWLAEPSGIAEIQAAGYDIDEFRAESARRLDVQMAATRPVFERFAEIVADQRLWLTASMLLPSGSSTNAL